MPIYIATASWSLRKEQAAEFQAEGSHLERYAARFNGVEINTSFYRPHRTKTYERWAVSTPAHFRFAVKVPKQITHVARLGDTQSEVEEFGDQVAGLGDKLGGVLVQLPPSLAFDLKHVEPFFTHLQRAIPAPIFCEPRHKTWFTAEINALLVSWHIHRVAVDPAVNPSAEIPGGAPDRTYFRWHGSPQMYYSNYDSDALAALANKIRSIAAGGQDIWCVFDNTADGYAIPNALALQKLIRQSAST